VGIDSLRSGTIQWKNSIFKRKGKNNQIVKIVKHSRKVMSGINKGRRKAGRLKLQGWAKKLRWF
jgi:hypothetical protein